MADFVGDLDMFRFYGAVTFRHLQLLFAVVTCGTSPIQPKSHTATYPRRRRRARIRFNSFWHSMSVAKEIALKPPRPER